MSGSRSVGAGRLRLLAVFAVVITLAVLARPTVRDVAAGAVVMAFGEAIRLWAAGYLRKNVELVTSGPYRWTRNPLYLGRLLIWTGLCVMSRLPGSLHWLVLAVGWAVFFGVYLRRKERVEPARLRALHGDAYERYRAAVPALFPSRRPWPAGGSTGWSSERMIGNREPWMLAGIVTLTLAMLWRAHAGGG